MNNEASRGRFEGGEGSSSVHLQDRRNDWESATDQEIVDALVSMPAMIEPRFMAWLGNHRPALIRRSLLIHRDLGGYLGPPGQRFLKGRR